MHVVVVVVVRGHSPILFSGASKSEVCSESVGARNCEELIFTVGAQDRTQGPTIWRVRTVSIPCCEVVSAVWYLC